MAGHRLGALEGGGGTGRSGRQKEATRCNMRREERVTVQGPVKKQQPDVMSHGGYLSPLPMQPCPCLPPSPLEKVPQTRFYDSRPPALGFAGPNPRPPPLPATGLVPEETHMQERTGPNGPPTAVGYPSTAAVDPRTAIGSPPPAV